MQWAEALNTTIHQCTTEVLTRRRIVTQSVRMESVNRDIL